MTTLFSLYPQTPHTNNRHTQLRASAPFKPSNDFTVNIQYKWQLWRGDQTPKHTEGKHKHTLTHTQTDREREREREREWKKETPSLC